MHHGNSYVLVGVAAAATALASAALAGGEAGKLELRDFGAQVRRLHDEERGQRLRSTC